MQAIVYLKSNRQTVTVVKDVTQVTGNNIFGLNSSAEGINLVEADIIVLDTEEEYEYGRVISVHAVDHKEKFVKKTIEEVNAELMSRLAALETALTQSTKSTIV